MVNIDATQTTSPLHGELGTILRQTSSSSPLSLENWAIAGH